MSNLISHHDGISARSYSFNDGYVLSSYGNLNKTFLKTANDLGKVSIMLGDSLEEEAYKDIANKISSYDRGFNPKYMEIFTAGCNANCYYCYYSEKDKQTKLFPSIDQIDKALETFKEIETCILMGGEPLVEFEAVKRILNHLDKNTDVKNIILSTNGRLLDEEKFDFFDTLNLNISLRVTTITDPNSVDHITIDEFIDIHNIYLRHGKNVNLHTNVIVSYEQFDIENFLDKLISINDKTSISLKPLEINFSEEQFWKMMDNTVQIINSNKIDNLKSGLEQIEDVNFFCKHYFVSLNSEGYTYCSREASSFPSLGHNVTREDYVTHSEKIIRKDCLSCDGLSNRKICYDKIVNKECGKLNKHNCYACPVFGKCTLTCPLYDTPKLNFSLYGMEPNCILQMIFVTMRDYIRARESNEVLNVTKVIEA
jgi:uncharacterized Fe-S cluster-containing radical SAM superfamily protein